MDDNNMEVGRSYTDKILIEKATEACLEMIPTLSSSNSILPVPTMMEVEPEDKESAMFRQQQLYARFQAWALRNYGETGKTKTVTRSKYNRVKNILKGIEMATAENSKLRFWVKAKGFRLGKETTSYADLESDDLYIPSKQAVSPTEHAPVEKTFKRVAVVEDFFDIIYNVHVEMDGRGGKHAGQKRTYRAIAQTYAFLPREAVTKFLMSCSDCQKRMHLTMDCYEKGSKESKQSNNGDGAGLRCDNAAGGRAEGGAGNGRRHISALAAHHIGHPKITDYSVPITVSYLSYLKQRKKNKVNAPPTTLSSDQAAAAAADADSSAAFPTCKRQKRSSSSSSIGVDDAVASSTAAMPDSIGQADSALIGYGANSVEILNGRDLSFTKISLDGCQNGYISPQPSSRPITMKENKILSMRDDDSNPPPLDLSSASSDYDRSKKGQLLKLLSLPGQYPNKMVRSEASEMTTSSSEVNRKDSEQTHPTFASESNNKIFKSNQLTESSASSPSSVLSSSPILENSRSPNHHHHHHSDQHHPPQQQQLQQQQQQQQPGSVFSPMLGHQKAVNSPSLTPAASDIFSRSSFWPSTSINLQLDTGGVLAPSFLADAFNSTFYRSGSSSFDQPPAAPRIDLLPLPGMRDSAFPLMPFFPLSFGMPSVSSSNKNGTSCFDCSRSDLNRLLFPTEPLLKFQKPFQLNELTNIPQVIAGYRDSAAFLRRSADELETLLRQKIEKINAVN